jgi:cytochrome b involved in lipid metabolism
MRFIQSKLGRVAAGAVLPLAVIAGLVAAPAVQAVGTALQPGQIAPLRTLAPVAHRALAPAATAAVTSYTLAQIAPHNSQGDCWTAINGGVYNLNVNNFINNHEGGTKVLLTLCGLDGSGMFNKQHAGQSDPASQLARLRIGAFDPTPPPVPATTFTIAQVAAHSSQGDCYSAINGIVYNLTGFMNHHPGGNAPILGLCGFDGTASFNGKHGASTSAQGTLATFAIGHLTGPTTTPTPAVVFTQTQLAAHSTATDCYSAINGIVYDLTAFAGKHAGGSGPILLLCGTDGSSSFNGKHGPAANPLSGGPALLAQQPKMGTYAGGTTPAATGTYTLAQIGLHNKTTDCWVAITGTVYDLTKWKGTHTGTAAVIDQVCGTDATLTFYNKHSATASSKLGILSAFKVGTQSGYVATALPTPVTVAAITTHGDYTMADVAKHSSASDCWSVINGSIYGLSTWIPVHPGGASVVSALCGTDGTAAYNGKHGGSASAGDILAKLRIGALVGSTAKPQGQYTLAEVAAHKTAADCWSAINGNVYDLTQWVKQHPGGPAVIEAMCGIDGSASYNGKHGTNAKAQAALDQFKIGTLTGSATPVATPLAAKPAMKVFTAKQVRAHHTAGSCWTVVNAKVYNLTPLTKKMRGRSATVKAICGHNSSKAFNKKYRGTAKANRALKRFLIGTYGRTATPTKPAATTAAPAASGLYTVAQVAAHSTPADCWSIVSGGVYNLTAWIGQHPGGPAVIKAMCGTDGTASYKGMHSSSASAAAALAKLKVGVVG